MKGSKTRFFAIFVFALVCTLAACAEKTPDPPEPQARMMLEVESCGWQEPGDPPGFQEGLLVISESLDDYTEHWEFTNILSPETMEETTAFDGKGLWLQRREVNWSPADPTSIFVSEEADYEYLVKMLAGLTFSTELSQRNELDAGLLLATLDLKEGEWEETGKYFLCPDGTVLLGAGIDPVTHYPICYESSETADYHRVSAMEIKYNLFSKEFYWECFDYVRYKPESYRLCISSRKGHRDFTLEEARALLPETHLMKGGQINRVSLANGRDYLKITEYSWTQERGLWENTYYLTPENKLFKQRNSFGTRYHTGHWEWFKCSLVWTYEDVLDYDNLSRLLEGN